jgi:hypothetical protein
VLNNQLVCAKILLDAGADGNIRNTENERAYDLAVRFSKTEAGVCAA